MSLKSAGRTSAPWRGLGDLYESFHWLPKKRKLNAHEILQAGNCFKLRTGRGAEDFHPKWFAFLPESARAEFAELLNRLEVSGCWPEQLRATLIKLIPKAKGGKRPIGLLVALIRLWERARVLEVRQWKATAFRP